VVYNILTFTFLTPIFYFASKKYIYNSLLIGSAFIGSNVFSYNVGFLNDFLVSLDRKGDIEDNWRELLIFLPIMLTVFFLGCII